MLDRDLLGEDRRKCALPARANGSEPYGRQLQREMSIARTRSALALAPSLVFPLPACEAGDAEGQRADPATSLFAVAGALYALGSCTTELRDTQVVEMRTIGEALT